MTSKAYKVFLSHAGIDTYVTEQLLLPRLSATGAEVFLDAGEIEYGDDFRTRLLEELRNVDELVVFLTRDALERPWVFVELGAALVRGARIVAICYGATETELQRRGVLSILGTSHRLHLDDLDRYVNELKRRVERSAS